MIYTATRSQPRVGTALVVRLFALLLLWSIWLAAANAISTVSYKLSPGDRINVLVFGEPELSVQGAYVTSTGTITFPLLGEVQVSGLTTSDLEKRLTTLFQNGYLRNPDITVTLAEYRPIYVSGAISRPGAFAYKEGLTVAKAVALAGGYAENAAEDDIKITRIVEDKEISLEASPQSELDPGDVLKIGSRTSANVVFYVHGEVGRPGAYPYVENLTVEKAVALAGGFGKRASKRKIEIVREKDPERKPVKVQLSDAVEPGDVITIGISLF